MKLVAKFSLVFILVFGIGFAVAAYLAQGFLHRNAVDQVIQNAGLMMQAALSMRTYTSQQIKPLLKGETFQGCGHKSKVSQVLRVAVPRNNLGGNGFGEKSKLRADIFFHAGVYMGESSHRAGNFSESDDRAGIFQSF